MKLNLKKKSLQPKVEEFKTFIQHQFDQATFAREERLDEYERAWYYYRRLDPVFKNRAFCMDYIAPVLQEAVDSIMPSMLNVFVENDKEAVSFRPLSKFVPTEVACAVNNEINDIFLRKNKGEELLYDAFLEALVTGNAYAKAYSCEKVIEEVADVEEYMPAQLMLAMLEEYPDTDEEQFITRTKNGIAEFKTDGEIKLVRIETEIKAEHVPFGRLFVDPVATSICDARYLCERSILTKGELIDRFTKIPEGTRSTALSDKEVAERIVSANTANGISETDSSLFKLETWKALASKEDYYTNYVDEMEVDVYLYEHYIYSSLLSNDKSTKLYQVFSLDGDSTEILEINEVECHPYVSGTPEPLPDSFWGISQYSKLKHEQDLMTWLTGEIAENSTSANMGRYTAIKGQYDRKQLLDNRPGGVVEMTTAGAISLMPYHALPNSTDNLFQKMQANLEEVKGNAVGLDLQGSLNNVAASTVALAVQNAELQDKKFSKAMAITFVKPLFEKLYKLIKAEDLEFEHEDKQYRGKTLPNRFDFNIDVNTSNDEARIAGQLMNIANTEAQLSQVESEIMTAQERYNIYERALKATGAGIDTYIKNPADKPEPTPEEQAKQAEMQKGQEDALRIQRNTAEIEMRLKGMELVEKEAKILDMQRQTELDAIEAAAKAKAEFDGLKLEEVKTSVDTLQKEHEMQHSQRIAEMDQALTLATGNAHNNISH